MRRTKIVCTIGPASQNTEILSRLIKKGMDVARLNFSHGNPQDHYHVYQWLRKLSRKLNKPLAILQDLQGPKMRVGIMHNGQAELKEGQLFILTTSPLLGSAKKAYTDYHHLPRDVKPGSTILMGDGYLHLKVKKVKGEDVITEVINGGLLKSHMGINLPGIKLSAPPLTKKDKEDLTLGISWGVDFVAMSFVRRSQDVQEIKKIMAQAGKEVPVIAKLERPEAIANLEEIIDVSAGVMVARGDLGVEMPLAQVPLLQKQIICRANQKRRLVITATQMLESMISNPRPTRAEVSDVANAIFDGTDAVMLSGETAVGKYPEEAVDIMAQIITAAESQRLYSPEIFSHLREEESIPDAIAQAAVQAAQRLHARAIVAFTQSGATALLISKYQPTIPIIAFTPHQEIYQMMNLFWGVFPQIMKPITNTDLLIEKVEKKLLQEGIGHRGDTIVLLMGAPIYKKGTTNLLKILKIR
ncbi:MAG: pyruvate kinase [Thermodesulfobacteriota bacterium]